MLLKPCHHGVVVITSASHAEGPRFEPAWWQKFCEEVKVECFVWTQQFSSSTCNGLVAVVMNSPWYKIRDCQKLLTCRKSAVRARVVTKGLQRSESLWICWTLCMNATEFSSFMWNGNDAVETMSPWCSGYHICLTRRRSAVRAAWWQKFCEVCMNATEFSSSMCNRLVSVEMIAPRCKTRDCQICFTCRKSAVRDQGDKYFVRNESIRICWKICMNATEIRSCIWNGLDAV